MNLSKQRLKIYLLNGPNLNRLGLREPEVYGSTTLAELETHCRHYAQSLSIDLDCRQSNHEGQLVDWIHQAEGEAQAIILNAGAYSHSSIALHDALRSVTLPCLEVHISNIHRREAFRHHSYTAMASVGVIAGLGIMGYELAILALERILRNK
ncbi:MAG: type II 3-dehydroquinate dehydratase, partial [Candidatus Pacebacteria bacterium]|nr:type II 3-dehydroquinate dehydratase [Candidatus Paceibacterota bacterium]